MWINDTLTAFAAIFPAELPDKSMVASILLVTRYHRPGWVWLGVVGAFAVHVVVAVAAGSVIGLLPDVIVQVVVAALFAIGAVLLWRAGSKAQEMETAEVESSATIGATVLGSFGLIILAEWGDLTQLATASLAAGSGRPVATGVGAWVALAAVAAIAVSFGRQLVARVPLHRINYLGAVVFAALAVWTLLELLL